MKRLESPALQHKVIEMSDSTENTNKYLARATSAIITQLAKILVKQGISYGLFEQWSRKAFVDAAEYVMETEDKRVTTAGISALTGINRKDTKRLRELGSAEDIMGLEQRYNRAVKVISGWVNDPIFQTKGKKPAVLELTGDDEATFTNLVKLYSGDMSWMAIQEMLETAGCVEVKGNTIKLIKTAYVPRGKNRRLDIINIIRSDVPALIKTIAYNMDQDEPSDRLYQRKLYNSALKSEYLPEFKRMAAEKSQALLVELNDWLTKREAKSENEDREYVSLNIFLSDFSPPKVTGGIVDE